MVAQRLRAAFGRFATGVAFVTTEVDGSPFGLIVSSFTAVSLHPPLISFCPAGANRFAEPLCDPLAALDCTVEAELPCGDHSIVVGRVDRLDVHDDGDPLVYFAGSFGAFLPHHQEIPCPPNSNP